MKRHRADAIVECLNGVLQPHGFSRKGRVWSRANEETVLMVHLQGTPFGGTFYVNLGVFIRDLSRRTRAPKSIHARFRGDWANSSTAGLRPNAYRGFLVAGRLSRCAVSWPTYLVNRETLSRLG